MAMRSVRLLVSAAFVAIAVAGCGGGSGAGLNCPAAPQTCDTAIDLAHMEGFNRAVSDVSLRRLVNYGMSPALKAAFEQVYSAPYIVKMLMAELEPTRRYQPSSTSGAGVRSHGPYYWRTPREFYTITDDFFKTETGSMSVPTLESIHGMMPKKDWEMITDDWADAGKQSGGPEGTKKEREVSNPLSFFWAYLVVRYSECGPWAILVHTVK